MSLPNVIQEWHSGVFARHYVIHHLPNLHFLDSSQVSTAEREEAVRRGQFMRIMRPVRAYLILFSYSEVDT